MMDARFILFNKENDVAAAATGIVVVLRVGGGAGSFRAGAALAPPPPPPNRSTIGPKKARDLGPAEKRAPSPNGSSLVQYSDSRSVSLPSPPPSHVPRTAAPASKENYITIIAAVVVRIIAAARAPPSRPVPSCPVDCRRQTLAHARTDAGTSAIRTRAKGSARPANALQSLDHAQLFRVSSESELLPEHSSSRSSPPPLICIFPPWTY